MRVDPDFEEFSRSVPGVVEVMFLGDGYCVLVQASDWYPVRRMVCRWMQAHHRSFGLSWSVHCSTAQSTYASLDRAISSLTYVHKPEDD